MVLKRHVKKLLAILKLELRPLSESFPVRLREDCPWLTDRPLIFCVGDALCLTLIESVLPYIKMFLPWQKRTEHSKETSIKEVPRGSIIPCVSVCVCESCTACFILFSVRQYVQCSTPGGDFNQLSLSLGSALFIFFPFVFCPSSLLSYLVTYSFFFSFNMCFTMSAHFVIRKNV